MHEASGVVAPMRQAERRVSEAHILPAEDVDAVHPRDVAALVQPAREEPPKGLSVEDRLGPRGVIEDRVDGPVRRTLGCPCTLIRQRSSRLEQRLEVGAAHLVHPAEGEPMTGHKEPLRQRLR